MKTTKIPAVGQEKPPERPEGPLEWHGTGDSQEWRQQARERCRKATPFCAKCRDKGTIPVRHGMVYITDDDEERSMAWHDEDCPDCGNFARQVRVDLPKALDALDAADQREAELREEVEQSNAACVQLQAEIERLKGQRRCDCQCPACLRGHHLHRSCDGLPVGHIQAAIDSDELVALRAERDSLRQLRKYDADQIEAWGAAARKAEQERDSLKQGLEQWRGVLKSQFAELELAQGAVRQLQSRLRHCQEGLGGIDKLKQRAEKAEADAAVYRKALERITSEGYFTAGMMIAQEALASVKALKGEGNG